MTPMSSRMRSAGVHTASPQYLSRGKCSLSRITACTTDRIFEVITGSARHARRPSVEDYCLCDVPRVKHGIGSTLCAGLLIVDATAVQRGLGNR
jgi:hypothetical protein